MKQFKFNIQGAHESHSGVATILEPETSIIDAARLFHDADNVTVREIGPAEDEGTTYKIFESYVDSAGIDYEYFATPYFQN